MKFLSKYTTPILTVLAAGLLIAFTTLGHADELSKSADTATALLASIVDGVKDLTTQYGKPATELALETVRMKSVQNLINGGVGLGLFLSIWIGYRESKKWYDKLKAAGSYDPEFCFTPLIVYSIFTGLLGLMLFGDLLSAKTWYGLYHPEVVLASEVIAKILH